MSTTTSQLTVPPAPWKSTFLEHLTHMPSPEFVLATLHPTSKWQTPAPTTKPDPPAVLPYIPRVRYCIYRGMWGELPDNKHNTAPHNPRVYESELPTFTTDVRMDKVPELFASGKGKAEREEQVQGSGGGGPCEAAWWIKETGTQWRMKGTAFVVGQDIDSEDGTSGTRTVKSEVGRRMRVVDQEKADKGDWSWGKELTAHFGNCSPGMRGSWRNPPPGTPTKGQEPDPEHQLGQKVEDLEDPIARANFRVVIIKPDEVEQCDISDPVKARRTRYTFVVDGEGEGQGRWEVEELWP